MRDVSIATLEVEAVGRRRTACELSHAALELLTIGGFDDAVTPNLQQSAEQETRVGAVVGDENQRRRRARVLRVC